MKEMDLQFSLPVAVLKEHKRFVAYTPALDLSTSGKTYKEAQRRFGEAAALFLEEIFKKGTADQVLQELGWRRVRKSWQPPVVISQKSEVVSIAA